MAISKTCPTCGNSFEASVHAAIYCSRECYHKSKRKEREKLYCEQCGNPLAGHQLKHARRYCCRDCYEQSRKPEMVTKHCPVCDKDFTVAAAIADRYNVCSLECRLADTKYVACERCGTVFRAEKHLNRQYCSEECRRPPKIVVCRNCDKEFRDVPSNGKQFCSFACYRRFNGENNLEQLVRVTLQNMGIDFIQEYQIGRYSIDFLLAEHQIALEIDGAYWHQDEHRDARKNKYLQRNNLHVVRITDCEIEQSDNVTTLIWNQLRQYLDESSNGIQDVRVDYQFLIQMPLLAEPFFPPDSNK